MIWSRTNLQYKNTSGREPRKAIKMEKKLTLFKEDAEKERKGKKKRMFHIISCLAVIAITLIVIFVILPTCSNDPKPNVPTETPEVTEAPTVEPTEAPTEEPTEVPTEEPTPEPTEIPEGWYVDPMGVIPTDVEILVYDRNDTDQNNRWCITKVDGKAILQLWTKSGLSKEWEVPEGILKAESLEGGYSLTDSETIGIYAYLSRREDGAERQYPIYYLENGEGQYMYIESTSYMMVADGILFGTTDGKAVWYHWGDNYYKMHDFGNAHVYIDSCICVNSEEFYDLDDLNWKKVEFNQK